MHTCSHCRRQHRNCAANCSCCAQGTQATAHTDSNQAARNDACKNFAVKTFQINCMEMGAAILYSADPITPPPPPSSSSAIVTASMCPWDPQCPDGNFAQNYDSRAQFYFRSHYLLIMKCERDGGGENSSGRWTNNDSHMSSRGMMMSAKCTCPLFWMAMARMRTDNVCLEYGVGSGIWIFLTCVVRVWGERGHNDDNNNNAWHQPRVKH